MDFNNPDFYSEALRLHSMGLSLIPIGSDKKAAIRWKRNQTRAADRWQIRDWFDCRDDLGIGVVLGGASQNLMGRDFDDRIEFENWMSTHKSLAKELPIVGSCTGGHVYFRDVTLKTRTLADGELRGNGSYLIAPPSLHPSGVRYRWINPIRELPRMIDPIEEGLVTRAPEWNPENQIIALGNRSDSSVESEVAKAISMTLPKRFGQRNDLIFEFARRLKGIPDLRLKSAREVLKYAEDWFRQALPHISTKDWKVTSAAFSSAWERIIRPFTDGILRSCLHDVDRSEPSPIALRYQKTPITMRLVGLCERLQLHCGESPFFLSTNAYPLFGLNYRPQLDRPLKRLQRDGVLERVSVGNRYLGLASEYRFTGK